MNGKKKSLDGFLPSSKNAGTFFVQKADGDRATRPKYGISSRQLLEQYKNRGEVAQPAEKPRPVKNKKPLDLSSVVALPTRNGNDLKIKVPVDEVVVKKEPVKSDEETTREALEFLNDDMDGEITEVNENLLPDFDKPDESNDDDNDNDLDVDEEDLAEYRSRREARSERVNKSSSERNIMARVAVIIVVLAMVVGLSYVVFAIFYNAPPPAQVEESTQTDNSKIEAPATEDTTQDSTPVTPEVETVSTIAVYNAGIVEGAAARLVESLVQQGLNAEVKGNVALPGQGYTIFDLTGGTKPQTAAKLAELYKTQTIVTQAADLPAGVQADVDFVIIIH